LNYFTNNEEDIEYMKNEGADPNQSVVIAIKNILNQNSQVSIRSLNLEDEDSVRELLW